MSVNFTAILDHRMSATHVVRLPERLHPDHNERLTATTSALLRRWNKTLPYWDDDLRWRIEQQYLRHDLPHLAWIEGDVVDIEGPAHLSLHVSRHTCYLHWRKWTVFLSDDFWYEGLRQVCRDIAQVIGASQVIYLPSHPFPPVWGAEMVYQGAAMAEIEQWLRNNCGDPAASREAIYREEPYYIDKNGYLIEVFAEPTFLIKSPG